MRAFQCMSVAALFAALLTLPLWSAPAPQQPANALNEVVAKISARENQEVGAIRRYSPLVETYIQRVKPQNETWAPDGDRYFLGRAQLAQGFRLEPLTAERSGLHRDLSKLFGFGVEFLPQGFLQMLYPDATGFSREYYHFDYVRREFLGEVRCLVFDVTPLARSTKGRFLGRIWVEDQTFTIVRFNGTYSGNTDPNLYFSFDSWRVNAGPNLWLPAVIYSEESNRQSRSRLPTFKAQTRIWGYNLGDAAKEEELGKVIVESADPVKDQSQDASDLSPLEEQRAWNRQAEDNVLDRFQSMGLIAPEGGVDKILDTVVNNLEVTNHLDIQPEVRCRVLMTSTIEAFDLGHTIVLSRGMIDVLPDEPSLAVMLAEELGHIVLGHQLASQFGFQDQMLNFDERKTFQHFGFARTKQEDEEAGAKAAELLKNSPYKDQLHTAELFLAELERRSKEIPNLISPHLGDPVLIDPAIQADLGDSPAANQIVALPLGGRIKIDPWDDTLVMLDAKPVNDSGRLDTMPFEVTPFMLYLTRINPGNVATPAESDSAQKN